MSKKQIKETPEQKKSRMNRERCYRWRAKNPEAYRAYSKEYMRRWRAGRVDRQPQ